MAKNVKSDDPRKPVIVAALKARSGCTKVALVTELPGGVFRGNCMWPSNPGARAGMWEVTTKELGAR